MTDSKKETIESEPADRNRPSGPILTLGIGTRIEEVARKLGGKRALAEHVGLSESQLHRIVSGQSKPKAEVVAAIAMAGKVNANWLLTGEGPERLQGAAEGRAGYAANLGPALVADAAAALYELVNEKGLEMTPKKFGRAVALAAQLKHQNEDLDLRELVREIVYIAM